MIVPYFQLSPEFQPKPPLPPPLHQESAAVTSKMEQLQSELSQLRTKKQELERNIANCDNQALQMRFEQSLAEVAAEVQSKEAEVVELSIMD